MTEERLRALGALQIASDILTSNPTVEWSEKDVVDCSLATAQVYAILDLAKAIRQGYTKPTAEPETEAE